MLWLNWNNVYKHKHIQNNIEVEYQTEIAVLSLKLGEWVHLKIHHQSNILS